MFTFLMGVKTNKRAAFHIGRRTIGIAVSSFIVTMISGLAFRHVRLDKFDPLYMPLRLAPTERTVIVAVQALTLLPVVTHLVYELKIPNSELGRLAISTAAVNDLLGFFNLLAVSYVGTYRYTITCIRIHFSISRLLTCLYKFQLKIFLHKLFTALNILWL